MGSWGDPRVRNRPMQTTEDRQFVDLMQAPLRALIVANGSLPNEALVRAEIDSADYTLAADGGANSLHALGMTCHAIIGDFDSIDADALPGIERIPTPDQEHTDLDKAIEHLITIGYRQIAMIGVTGTRLDHSFGALEMLIKYGRIALLRLIDDVGCACLAGDEVTFNVVPGQTVSLLPIGTVESVNTEGLKWNLKGEKLASGVRDGISNVALGDSVTVRTRGGNLVVYLHHRQPLPGAVRAGHDPTPR